MRNMPADNTHSITAHAALLHQQQTHGSSQTLKREYGTSLFIQKVEASWVSPFFIELPWPQPATSTHSHSVNHTGLRCWYNDVNSRGRKTSFQPLW